MFRYPGGKSKLKNQIAAAINKVSFDSSEYREPFFGGGSIGTVILESNPNIKEVWINDYDLGIACLWTSLIRYPNCLKNLVNDFTPTVQSFYDFKEELIGVKPVFKFDDDEIVDYGFKKLAIHQISYSGLGTKSGGPLGGRDQKSAYKIDCRWSPKYICKKIDLLHRRFLKFSIKNNACTNLDFSELINDSCDSTIYLDPPYFQKGNDLYQHGFTIEDHIRLADCLKKTKNNWILSYDDCPEIRKYYEWANIQEIEGVAYTITATKDKETGERKSRSKLELLISSK